MFTPNRASFQQFFDGGRSTKNVLIARDRNYGGGPNSASQMVVRLGADIESQGEAQQAEGRPNRRILCLDGGSIRGISTLLILQRIMEEVKRIEKLEETPRPCEYFSLIGGTSTGRYSSPCSKLDAKLTIVVSSQFCWAAQDDCSPVSRIVQEDDRASFHSCRRRHLEVLFTPSAGPS
ncbi:hypothetical protein WAI453_011310 [Rhynchosporium graminicola]